MLKRVMFILASALLALGLMGFAAAAKDKALLVCIADLNGSDDAITSKIKALGFDLTIVDHASASDEDPGKYALVVLSSTSTSGNIVGAPGYIDTASPVLHWESALLDDYQQAPTTLGAWDFEDPVFVVKDAKHPIVAGFKSSFQPYTGTVNLHSGVPEVNAIAMIDGTDYAGVMAFEKGDKMANGAKAPGRRVFIASGDAAWESASADGMKLFEQAVKWLVRK